MLQSPKVRANIANQLILYDQVVIPTGNLQILPVLRLVLGEDIFDELVREKIIVLARYDSWIAYFGNGSGLSFFTAHDNPDHPEKTPNIGLAYHTPLDETIDVALQVTLPASDERRKKQLRKLLFDNIVELPLNKIGEKLRDETYRDILGCPYLHNFFALRNAGRSMNSLLGIQANQVTVLCPHVEDSPESVPEIIAVLKIAFENILLGMGTHVQASDIASDAATLSVLRAKGQHFGMAERDLEAFARVEEIEGVPNIGEAFAEARISPRELLDLRNSKHAQAMRDWLASSNRADAQGVVRDYVETIGKPSVVEKLPAQLIRFAATTALGEIPVVGTVASAIDTFLLSKWFPGRSPRLFLHQAKTLVLPRSATVPPPLMKGKDRNKPCPCGSGRKYKVCCGR